MRLRRRQFLQFAGAAAAAPAFSCRAWALDYPTRPVHLVVGFAAGGPQDIVMRLMCQWLSERLGQSFIVDNKPGASGNIGAETVVRAAPDGYTLLSVSSPNAINASLYQHLNYNFIRDIAPVAGIMRVPLVMEVNPSLPVKTVPEFIAYAKANPGKISYASAGIGTPQHVSAELFKMMTGVEMVHVPYRGAAPALTDLIGGQVQVMIDTSPASMQHIRSGKVRALAVTTAARVDVLPDLPTVSQYLPGYEATSWFGVLAPAKTPRAVIDKIDAAVNKAIADAAVRKQMDALGVELIGGTPDQFAVFLKARMDELKTVSKAANLVPQ